MRIIDLYNMVANNEKLPKQIQWDGKVYNKIEIGDDYYNEESDIYLFRDGDTSVLNDEIKIVGKMEHYDMFDYFTGYKFSGTDKDLLNHLEINFTHINEELEYLINEINKIKEK